MILEINPSFVKMNDMTGIFYTAGEREALGLFIQRQQQPGGRGKGKSSLGSDLQAVLHLASQKGQLGPPPGSLRVWIFLLLITMLWSACSGSEPFD